MPWDQMLLALLLPLFIRLVTPRLQNANNKVQLVSAAAMQRAPLSTPGEPASGAGGTMRRRTRMPSTQSSRRPSYPIPARYQQGKERSIIRWEGGLSAAFGTWPRSHMRPVGDLALAFIPSRLRVTARLSSKASLNPAASPTLFCHRFVDEGNQGGDQSRKGRLITTTFTLRATRRHSADGPRQLNAFDLQCGSLYSADLRSKADSSRYMWVIPRQGDCLAARLQ